MKRGEIRSVIISRTDAIGDVVLTLPMAAGIKKLLGNSVRVLFFGRSYTKPVIDCCSEVDEFIDYDVFAANDESGRTAFLKQINADAIIHVFPRPDIATSARLARIPIRIGTSSRFYHILSCTNLVGLKRRNSNLHEAQLNFKLLKPLGFKHDISLKDISTLYHFSSSVKLPHKFEKLLDKSKFKLIIHPKSHSSGREWSLNHYRNLIRFLPASNFQVIITGGEKEASLLQEWSQSLPASVMNLSGLLTLGELIALINSCNGIIAASTGPLHVGAALGKHALGIYPPIRPLHPMRWSPVGLHAEYVVVEKKCSDCRSNPVSCHCMNEISPATVEERIMHWIRRNTS